MTDGFTPVEAALLDSLSRERGLLRDRNIVNGMVLHEIANAATVVASGLDLIKHHPPNSPTYLFAVQQIDRGVGVLREMVDGLRALFDSTGAKLALVHGNLGAFVSKVVHDPVLVGSAAGRRVTVMAGENLTESSYCATLLRHALANLLRNALRYSPPQSPVTVLVRARGPHRWIHVQNRGVRIPPELASRLFEPGRKGGRGGMGFGLHITQACALRMGGRVVFGSTNAVTVFSLLLPVEHPAVEEPRPVPLAADAARA